MPPCLHLGHQLHVVVILEGWTVEDEAPQQEVDHANQHRHRKDVGEEAIDVADHPFTHKGDRKEPLKYVAEIDQEIEDKAPRNHGVEDIGRRTGLPDRLHREPFEGAGGKLAEHVFGAIRLAGAPTNHVEDLLEAFVAVVEGGGNSGDEEDFLNPSKHSLSSFVHRGEGNGRCFWLSPRPIVESL